MILRGLSGLSLGPRHTTAPSPNKATNNEHRNRRLRKPLTGWVSRQAENTLKRKDFGAEGQTRQGIGDRDDWNDTLMLIR
jgi:hypothetical protein